MPNQGNTSFDAQRMIRVNHIRVRKSAIDFELIIPLEYAWVDQRIAQRVLQVLPALKNQVCMGGAGEYFGDELIGTETAHLLEHVTLELMGSAYQQAFLGHTSWLEELEISRKQGVVNMQVSVSYVDDLVALQSFRHACTIVTWAISNNDDTKPEKDSLIKELHQMIG